MKKLTSIKAGFTLVELLVVIAIIGVLAAVGIPAFQGFQGNAKVNSSKANFTNAKNFIAAEMIKCQNSSGATILTTVSGITAPTCPLASAGAYTTWFQQYFGSNSSSFMNPYISNQVAYNANAATVKGGLSITTYTSGTQTGVQIVVNTGENNTNTLLTAQIPFE